MGSNSAQTMWITVVVVGLIAIELVSPCPTDAGFGFPEEHEGPAQLQNSQMKTALFVPAKCGDNELLYPGDYQNDWVCDCKPGFLYHPPTSKCYSPYRQGPCQPGYMLTLPDGSYIPQCSYNPCRIGDGYVLFRGGCHKLDTAGPCALAELWFTLSVNVTNLQLDCMRVGAPFEMELANRFGGDDDDGGKDVVPSVTAEVDKCAVGSQRWQEKMCSREK